MGGNLDCLLFPQQQRDNPTRPLSWQSQRPATHAHLMGSAGNSMGGGISGSPMREKAPKVVPEQGRRNLGIAIVCASSIAIAIWFWSASRSGTNGGIGLVKSLQEEKVCTQKMLD